MKTSRKSALSSIEIAISIGLIVVVLIAVSSMFSESVSKIVLSSGFSRNKINIPMIAKNETQVQSAEQTKNMR